MVELTEFLARNWPEIDDLPVTPWSVFALLLPTHLGEFWGATAPAWSEALPAVSATARDLVASSELVDLAIGGPDVMDVAAVLWGRLEDCVAEVELLATR